MTPDVVDVVHPDRLDEGPQRVTFKAWKTIYQDKGFVIHDATPPTPARPSSFVADASVDHVLAWVDGIPARAREALEAELDRPKPRVSLVSRLEAIVDAAAPDAPPED